MELDPVQFSKNEGRQGCSVARRARGSARLARLAQRLRCGVPCGLAGLNGAAHASAE